METIESEKNYTEEEIEQRFPAITEKTRELQAILNWYNSPEARNTAPDNFVRKELHYPEVEGTNLKTPNDPTKSMHIGEAVKQRYIDLFATAKTTEGYEFHKDPDRSETLVGAERFLLNDLPPEDRDKLRTDLEREVEEEVERIKKEKE